MAQTKYTNGSGVSEMWLNIKNWVTSQLLGYSQTGHTHNASDITSGLSTVATSGSYTDLSNKPTIPTKTSDLTNDSGYITADGAAYPRRVGGATMWFDWNGQDGQPNWLWGSNDGTNMYVYNPANFSVNYANSAGNSDTLDGYHEYSFLRYRGGTSTSGEGTLWAQIGIKGYYNALPDGLSGVYQWGEVVSLAGTNARFDIYCSHTSSDGNGLYYRSGWDDDKKAWRCFIDSANIGSQSVNYANSAGSANDPNAVHKSGDETIGGTKTYSSDICSTNSQHLWFRHLDGSNNGGMDGCLFLNYSNNAKNVYFNGGSYYINGGYYNGKSENSQYTYWLRTSSHTDHLLHTEWDGSYFWTYVTASDGGYRAVRVERSNSSGWADSAGGVAWGNVSGRPTALSQFTNDSGFITSVLPIGSYIQFAGSQAPAGFLVCNGGAISRTTYSALFAVIGTTYGSGDGWSTFNLPNLTDRFLQGSTSVGTVKNAGLPNITGERTNFSMYGDNQGTTGALTVILPGGGALASNAGTNNCRKSTLSFNASNSNSIYGSSSTVQPPALTCLICIKY